MSPEYSEMRMYAEMMALNRGFLGLLTRPGAVRLAPHLGLNGVVVEQLRQLSSTERDFVASTPGLLACIEPVQQFAPLRVAEKPDPTNAELKAWITAARLYTAGLLTWLLLIDKQQMPWRALCAGGEVSRPQASPGFDLARIENSAELAVERLRARFTAHPSFWPDLIHSARSTNPDFKILSQLKVIPYVLAEECAAD